MANIICPPAVFARNRKAILESSALLIDGSLERADGATNVGAARLAPLTIAASTRSRDVR